MMQRQRGKCPGRRHKSTSPRPPRPYVSKLNVPLLGRSGQGDVTQSHEFLPPPRLESSDEEEDGWEEGSEASTPPILPGFLQPASFNLDTQLV